MFTHKLYSKFDSLEEPFRFYIFFIPFFIIISLNAILFSENQFEISYFIFGVLFLLATDRCLYLKLKYVAYTSMYLAFLSFYLSFCFYYNLKFNEFEKEKQVEVVKTIK